MSCSWYPRRRSRFGLAAAFMAGMFTVGLAAPIAGAASVPFTDSNSTGAITLCGRDGRPVTSGSVLTDPFVWTAVSSTPGPSGYPRAYLVLYQPMQHVDPGYWTGYQLTEDSTFSNPGHPMTQATNADPPLVYVLHAMPPVWDGLYELRLYFAAPGQTPDTTSYPTAVIHVSGDSWTLVQGGNTPCNIGTAVSVETHVLPQSELATPRTIVVDPHPAQPASTTTTVALQASNVPSPSSTTTGVPAAGSDGGPIRGLKADAAGGKSSGGGTSAWVIAIVAAGVVVIGGSVTGFILRRKRLIPGSK